MQMNDSINLTHLTKSRFLKQIINNEESTETNLLNNAVVVWHNIRTPTIPETNNIYHSHLEEASSIFFSREINKIRDNGEI